MKKCALLLALLSLGLSSCGGKAANSGPISDYTRAELYMTTGSKSQLLQRMDDLSMLPYEPLPGTEIYVEPGSGRKFYGVGAALTHSSAYLLMNASEEVRDRLLDELFENGMNVLRIPLGTSDFTLPNEDFYTYDDIDAGQDYTLSSFSIEKENRYFIPAIKEILKRNPNIKIFAAPWSAPAWMKTSNDLVGGYLKGYDNVDLSSPSNEEKAYAEYLYKTIKAFDQAGIAIDYLSLVNEPLVSYVNYPSMRMTPECYYRVGKEFVSLIKDGPYDGLRLDVYDHNVGSMQDMTFESFASYLLEDEELNHYVGGFALHCYDGNWPSAYGDFLYNYIQSGENPEYGEKDFFITEVTESSSGVDFAQNLSWAASNVTVGPLGYGINAAMYWNLCLDKNGQPVKGNSSTCYGVITIDEDDYTHSAAYYALAHVFKFVDNSTGSCPEILSAASTNEATIKSSAYKNPNGDTVVILANSSDRTSEDVSVVLEEDMVRLNLQPQSLATLVFKSGEAEGFETIGFDHIDIYQTGINEFRASITMEEPASFSFYLGDTQDGQGAKLLEANKDGDSYTTSFSHDPGDFYLIAKSGDKEGFMLVTLPSMKPSISRLEGETYAIQANFGLDSESSWSSFCDPNGKRIYRSSHQAFDSSAEQVNVTSSGGQDNIYITTEEYGDAKADPSKPYYYFVMDSKAGKVTYHSGAVSFRDNFFANETLSLEMKEGKPCLVYRADDVKGGQEKAALEIKDISGETHYAYNHNNPGLEISLDLTNLQKRGVWYDICVISATGASSFEFEQSHCSDYSAKLDFEGIQYEFQSWEGIVKINATSI